MRLKLATLLLLVASATQAQFAVVASIGSPVQELDRRQVANIFLARTNRLPNGGKAKPLELNDEQVKARFYHEVTGKTLPQINSYWTTLIFTGKGRPPHNVDNRQRLIEALNSNPNAISYLPLDQVPDGLKVLYVIRGGI